MRALITGATGFVGQIACAQALRCGFAVRGALRNCGALPDNIEPVVVGEINAATDWGIALRDVDVVMHLAARVHVMRDNSVNPLDEFRKVNVAGTEHLARQAALAGVKRLVFVSSIKVNGENTAPLTSPPPSLSEEIYSAYTELDASNPQDPYGVSKSEAEQALHRVAAETGLEVVIVRPPLVYGAEVKGNFAQMLKVLDWGIPLPLASVCNRRSLVYVENLVDALLLCATHPGAAGQTYLVSDGEDVSTPDLLRRLSAAMGRATRLLPCPPVLLKLVGGLTGKSALVERLLGSLRVDSGKIRRDLGWQPPYTLQEGLSKTTERNRNSYERKQSWR